MNPDDVAILEKLLQNAKMSGNPRWGGIGAPFATKGQVVVALASAIRAAAELADLEKAWAEEFGVPGG